MTFVFSPWYFVLILFVVAIVVAIVLFVQMDKKDRVIIDEFIKDSTNEPIKEESQPEQTAEEKIEEKIE